MFWRLMIGTVAMLAFGYAGESRTMDPVAGFAAGMAGWFYIFYEIFSGEAGKLAGSDRVNKHVAASFGTMRFIVTVGWSIYPLGYFFGYLQGAVSAQALNWEVLRRLGELGGSWEVPGVYLEVLGGPSGVLGRSLGVLAEPLGGPRSCLGCFLGFLGMLGWRS